MYVVTIKPISPDAPDCKVEFVTVKGGLSDWQNLVGGLIEVVPTFQDGVEMLINEEGKLEHMPLNLVATALTPLREYDFLVGTAVLVRLNKKRDNWTGWTSKEDAEKALCGVLDVANTYLADFSD